MKARGGSRIWYVADGWMPLKSKTRDPGYAGHEAIMILNSSDRDAEVLMDVTQPNLAYIGTMGHPES